MGLEFNGTNQGVQVGDSASLDLAGDMSMVTRLYPTNMDGTNLEIWIAKGLWGNDLEGDYSVSSKVVGGVQKVRFNIFTSTGAKEVVGGTTITNNNEYSIVGIRDANDIKVYLNALEDATPVAIGGTMNANAHDLYFAYLGAGTGVNNWFQGRILEGRVYNRALSLAEIQTIYYARGADNIVNGLVSRCLMNEKPDGGTATVASSVIDVSGNGNHGSPGNSPVYRAATVRLVRPPVTKTIFA